MTTYIEDSPRANLAGWIVEAVNAGTASAAVITPWASPYVHVGGPGLKPGVGPRTDEFARQGVSYWFDPMSHALQMPGVGDYRYYTGYNLWGGPVGDLTDDAYRREHVRRVFRVQDEIHAPHLAPAPLLPTGLNNLSTLALDTAHVAVEMDADSRLTIAGLGTFWSDGSDLVAHVGALAALQPSGWFVSYVHPANEVPPRLTAAEVYGVARTVRALAEHAPVHVSNGDFAALPAIAAGAISVGTGWDNRQRSVSASDYGPRPAPVPGQRAGGWLERPTFIGLLGSLSKSEGALLRRQDPTLAVALGELSTAPTAHDLYLHHVAQLNTAVQTIQAAGGYEARFKALDALYTQAASNWAALRAATGITNRAAQWVTPLQAGLRLFAASEGWVL
jgi:hypothetical protein